MSGIKETLQDTAPKEWERIQRELNASFLQSAGWGEFQSAIGHKPYYLHGDGWSCLILLRKASVGSYLFAPYGPTMDNSKRITDTIPAITSLARSVDADWIRLEPISDGILEPVILKSKGLRPAPKDVDPALTRIVNLTPEHDELLASLSQTTRNIIRRSYKDKPLSFKTSVEPGDMQIFSSMLDTVANRNRVGFYTHDYYYEQARIIMPLGMMRLEIAYDGSRPVGTAIIHDYLETCTYTYAASLPEARDKNVSALLLWQSMLNAKERGMKRMDLFGIAPDDAPESHPWAGFSSFKRKFGGEVIEHAGTWDMPLTSKYRLYRAGLKVKRLARR